MIYEEHSRLPYAPAGGEVPPLTADQDSMLDTMERLEKMAVEIAAYARRNRNTAYRAFATIMRIEAEVKILQGELADGCLIYENTLTISRRPRWR